MYLISKTMHQFLGVPSLQAAITLQFSLTWLGEGQFKFLFKLYIHLQIKPEATITSLILTSWQTKQKHSEKLKNVKTHQKIHLSSKF